ncbi:hypothetical protein [Halohasta salina]|uniref:hypothetical protein n=1 Tax=Halohasta salina TaxID=2961621 RepID=UPI0020A2537F|nr:hypothetical protein [Halohasta salina]
MSPHPSPSGASACLRDHKAARDGGAHTREAGTVDRGDGIRADGGSKRFTVRVTDPEIVAALDDADSQSDAIRTALRQTYGGEGSRKDDVDVPAKALDAYDELVEFVGIEAEIDEQSALSLIAQDLQIKKEAAKKVAIAPLESAGYVTVRGSKVVVHQEPGEHYDRSTGHHDIVDFKDGLTVGTKFGCRRCGRVARHKQHIKTRPCKVVGVDASADASAATAGGEPADD